MALVYAHRGASRERPENTWPAFARALELGCALETDVHLSADGHVVVAHDADGARMASDPRPIAGLALAELRRWDLGWGFVDAHGARPFAGHGIGMLTLAELLEAAPGARLSVDLKTPSPALAAAFVAVVRAARAEAQVVAASFHRASVTAVRALGYAGPTSLSPAEVALFLALPGAAFRRVGPAAQVAQLPTRTRGVSLARPAVVRRCRAAGLTLEYFTVNEPDEARALVALGADAIMTDDPARIVPALAQGAPL